MIGSTNGLKYSDNTAVTPTMRSSKFSLVTSSLRIVNGVIGGSVILQCTSTGSVNEEIFSIPYTFTTYSFLLCAVTTGQWTYDVNRMVRAYRKSTGAVAFNSSFTAGDYVTVEFNGIVG